MGPPPQGSFGRRGKDTSPPTGRGSCPAPRGLTFGLGGSCPAQPLKDSYPF